MQNIFTPSRDYDLNEWLKKQLNTIVPWLVPIALILIWQLAAKVGWISSRVLPSPLSVLQAGYQLTLSGELTKHVLVSGGRALVGFTIGGTIGLFFGLANGLFTISEKLFDTSIQMLRNIPHLAMIPLVILWFGIDEEAKIFLVSIAVLFPIYLNTFHGIRSIDPGLIEMGKVYGLSQFALFTQVIIPGALPGILVGVRFALGLMWLTLIVAETIAADSGIGYLAMNAREFMQTDIVVFSIILYALLGKLADTIAKLLESWCLQWHPNYQNA